MPHLTRRAALKAIGAGIAFPLVTGGATARGHVETVLEMLGSPVPENLAIARDGTLYFGVTRGEVRRLTPDQTQETGLRLDDADQVATLPGSAIGVELARDGTLYVASQADDETGVWEVPRNGGDPELHAAIEGFPNDVRYDGRGERLLVTESFGGTVFEVPLDADDPDTAASVWVDDDRLQTEDFGANGLTFWQRDALLVAVTRATNDAGDDVGRLVRVPVARDGSAGEPTTFLESESIFGADGITAIGRFLFVAANSRNEVLALTPAGDRTVIADGEDGLVFPSDVALGRSRRQYGDLFICNFANESPDDGAIFRTRLLGDRRGRGR